MRFWTLGSAPVLPLLLRTMYAFSITHVVAMAHAQFALRLPIVNRTNPSHNMVFYARQRLRRLNIVWFATFDCFGATLMSTLTATEFWTETKWETSIQSLLLLMLQVSQLSKRRVSIEIVLLIQIHSSSCLMMRVSMLTPMPSCLVHWF